MCVGTTASARVSAALRGRSNPSLALLRCRHEAFPYPQGGGAGAHVAWVYNVRSDYSLNAPSFGVNRRTKQEQS